MEKSEGETKEPLKEEALTESKNTPDTPRPKRRWLWWLLGVVIFLLIVTAVSWRFPWYRKYYNAYENGTITLKVEESNTFPVPGASLTISGSSYTTDADGRVVLTHIVAGSYSVTVHKSGYEDVTTAISVHRGDNDLQAISLKRVPTKLYSVKGFVEDYISTLPLQGVTVSLGATTLETDANGGYVFTNQPSGDYTLKFSKAGYNNLLTNGTVKDADVTTAQVLLTPIGNVIFTSNESGKRGIYTISYDGSNRKQLAASSGEEFNQVVSPNGKLIAFLSTRDGVQNSYGTVMPKLYVMSSDGSSVKKVSDDLISGGTIVWSPDSRYLYFEGYADPALTQPTTHFYDTTTAVAINLGSTDHWEAFSPDGASAVYVTNSNDGTTAQFTITLLTFVGVSKTVIVPQTSGYVSNVIYATNGKSITYDVELNSVHTRYQLTLPAGTPVPINSSQTDTNVYFIAPNGTQKAFIDERDGQWDVFVENINGSNQKRLTSLGVVVPSSTLTWDASSSYLTFAIKREGEQAMYVVALAGGEPKKVTNYYAVSQ